MPENDVDHALRLPHDQLGEALMALPENQWFDRKSGRVRAKDLAIALVAFANAEGGRVAVGLRSGIVEGVSPTQANALRQASVDFTHPPVRARAEEIPVLVSGELGSILVISVDPGDVVHELTNGDCYLRIGDESRKLSFAQRQELNFDRGHAPYDGTSVDGVNARAVTSEPLAAGWARALGAESVDSAMRARGLLINGAATVAAYLLFAEHPQDRFPQAQVRVLRYSDIDPGSGRRLALDDDADIRCEGPIPAVIDRAERAIERLLPRRRALGESGRFEPIPIVPRDAWLEGLVNAVIHRSYSMAGDHIRVSIYPDRIEIESPGRFPGIVDPSRPEQIDRYARNPRIARVCTDLRISQELGEGIRRIYAEMRMRGLVDPLYQQTAGSVRLTLSSADTVPEGIWAKLPRGARDTLDVLRRARHPLGTAEVLEFTSLSRPTVRRHLELLRTYGLVEWSGKSPNDPRATWRVL